MKQDFTLRELLSRLAAIPLRFPRPKDRPGAWNSALQAMEAKCLLIIEFGDRHLPAFREPSELHASIFDSRREAMELRTRCRRAAKTKDPAARADLWEEIRQAYGDLCSELEHVCLLMEPELAPSVALVMVTL